MALNSIPGQHYSTYSEPVRQWTQQILVTYLKDVHRFRRILDIGCGTGENTRYLQSLSDAGSVVGLDVNLNFLNFAEKYSKHRNIQYLEADLNKSSWVQDQFCVNQFDLVFSSFSLHWARDISRIFKEITEVMKTDAESFHVIGIRPTEPFSNTMKQMIFHEKWSNDLADFCKAPQWLTKETTSSWNKSKNPAEAMKSILMEAGHEVLLCKEVHVSYTCQSHEESKGMLEWLLPLTKFIPQTKMAEFMEDAHQIFKKYSQLQNDQVVWENVVLVVHSKRNFNGSLQNI